MSSPSKEQPMAVEQPTGAAPAASARVSTAAKHVLRRRETIKVYQRTNLIYWWPVWMWGYVCAALTFLQGMGISEFVTASGRPVLFHPASWVGWSFILVLLGVVYVTNVRARGIYSFVLIGAIALLALLLPYAPGVGTLGDGLSLLRIHLNLAFYVLFSSLVLILWLASLVVIDRLTWVKFTPGQVVEEHLLGQAVAHVYSSEGLVVRRLPDDFFRHKLLGLRWLGWGTGDFLIRPTHGESLELHNVWNANAKQIVIERLISTKMTDTEHPT
ncbi:MAG: hypothetical protein NW223_17505 [Hyphomicrobiaceae bacterium]|nr:hypothetical protein [Hyphomicrobiaceae bacterium]